MFLFSIQNENDIIAQPVGKKYILTKSLVEGQT